jgi:hypothetical protein
LKIVDDALRLIDPRTGAALPTTRELDRTLLDAQANAREAQNRAAAAEQEVERLRKLLAERDDGHA